MKKHKNCRNCEFWQNETIEHNGIYGQCMVSLNYINEIFICDKFEKKEGKK